MPPFGKSGILVGPSVCSPSNVHSRTFAHLLESCQTWSSKCHQILDVPYWLSGYIVKVKLLYKCCPLNIYWPYLVQWTFLEIKCPILVFRSYGQRLNYWYFLKCCPLNNFSAFCFQVAKLDQGSCPLNIKRPFCMIVIKLAHGDK